MLEAATDVAARAHLDVAAQDDGRDQQLAQARVLIDLSPQQADEHGRALGVADEDDGPAVVEVGQVVLPGRQHAGVGDGVGRRDRSRDPWPASSRCAAGTWAPTPAQSSEKRAAWATAAAVSTGCTFRLALSVGLCAHRGVHVEAVGLGIDGRPSRRWLAVDPSARTTLASRFPAQGSSARPGPAQPHRPARVGPGGATRRRRGRRPGLSWWPTRPSGRRATSRRRSAPPPALSPAQRPVRDLTSVPSRTRRRPTDRQLGPTSYLW